MHGSNQKTNEADFKVGIYQEYFGTKKYIFRQEIDKIDFIITDKADNHLLWAETKKNTADIVEMFVQLVLTIGKGRTFDKYNPPPFLAVFDYVKIAFLQYNAVHDLFYQNDFNWNVAPSNKKSKEFNLIKNIVEETINDKKMLFPFDTDKNLLREFIKNNFSSKLDLMPELITRLQIDKNNFVPTYYRWAEKVKPTIAINWDIAKRKGILDGDFYLADLLSDKNRTIRESLFVLLFMTYYELDRQIDDMGLFQSKNVSFKDAGKAHKEFWEVYQRPPKEELWDYIVERRDLLVPQDVRERKGSFFTPRIWVEKSQEYIAKALGDDWQDDYYVWDCAAGTGNLLTGLTNKYNIWASTLDQADVDIMKDRIKSGANLLEDHVFQFDFLNDDFDKLPKGLKNIIDDENKRKKLIVYINPPYAEAATTATRTGTGNNKEKVASSHKTSEQYKEILGRGINELFANFFVKIFKQMPNIKLASFGTMKYVTSQNFIPFRNYFKATFLKGFICPSYTFDNVEGKFPIGFIIWDLSNKEFIKSIQVDIFDKDYVYLGKKNIHAYNKDEFLSNWLSKHYDKINSPIGYFKLMGTDMQNNNGICIYSAPSANDIKKHMVANISKNNIMEMCIYLAVRHCIDVNWINNRDQYLYPNDKYKTDKEFQNNCLTFSLFHGQNKISSKEYTNHWIPFTEKEVNSRDNFESNFMTDFINGKIVVEEKNNDLFSANDKTQKMTPLQFSIEAKNVFNTGRELWKYYHKQADCNVNASFYDIREYFQGRNENGKMNNKSDNETYNELIGTLRTELKTLAEKIQPKVYEYGFLLE